LYNYLFAKKHGGDFILRIEDTDSQRFVPGAEAYIVETFQWLNIPFDEGVHTGGPYAPYRQSERKTIYKQHVDLLLNNGAAYIAFDTPAELEAKRKAIPNFQYDASTRMSMRNSLTLPADTVRQLLNEGHPYVVRIRIEPDEEVRVDDLIRGTVVVRSSVLDDKVLYKSADQLPTYHLANIVDDHLMKISHVIRGEEWLPSAPLHVLLYRCFGWEAPLFAHLPLLLKPDGNGKLSKRDGDRLGFPVFPLEWKDPQSGEHSSGYREAGYLPEAVINFLALLGWNPGDDREILSLDDLIALFSLERCSKSGAKFDYEKGKWFNHQYIQSADNRAIAQRYRTLLSEKGILADEDYTARVVELVKGRVGFISELWEQSSFFFVAPETYNEKAVRKRWNDASAQQLTELAAVLDRQMDFSAQHTEKVVQSWIEQQQYQQGNVMNAFRLAIVGDSRGPHLFDIIALIGKHETIERLRRAVRVLN
jgi:glutamyl-tRNA synthetase